MKNPFSHFPKDISPTARTAALSAQLMAVPHFLAAPFYLYLIWTSQTSSDAPFYTLAILSIVQSVLFGIGAVLSRRGRPTSGILLVLGVLVVSYPVFAVLVSGLGLVIGYVLMGAGPLIAFLVLPRRAARAMTVVTVASSLATVLLDVLGSTTRPPLPGSYIQILAVVGVGASVYFVVRRFRDYSLRTKFILAFSFTAILVVLVTAFIYYFTLQSQSLQEFRRTAAAAASLAALQQNGDEFARISSAQDPLYEKFRVQNLKIRRIDPLFVYVWTASKDENGLYFVVDAGVPGEENIAAFGERYDDPSPTLTSNYDTMTEAIADPEIYTDEFGSFLSAYAPIFTAAGQRVGVIGVDINADTIIQKQRQLLSQTLLIVFFAGLVSVFLGYTFGNLLTKPIERLTSDTGRLAGGDLSFRTSISVNDEVGKLGLSVNHMADQIQAMVAGLEDRVALRTEELRASADVGRAAASTLDTDQLLSQIVNLIVDRFGLYYAAVFIVDETGKFAVLQEATGEAGRTLKERNHQLEVGGQSMVGYVTAQRKARIALDIGHEAVRFANPLLPDTRSEIALPLMVGNRVLGALDVQSSHIAAFDEASAAVLQSMADQIAVALSNAEQFRQTSLALQRAENLSESIRVLVDASNLQEVTQHLARYANTLVAANRTAAYLVDHDLKQVTVQAVAGDNYDPELLKYEILNSGISGQVFRSGQPVLSLNAHDGIEPAETAERRQQNGTGALIVVPLVAQGKVIGTFTVSNLAGQRLFDQHDVELLMTLAAQSASVIEKLRLFEQAQRALSDLDAVNRRLTGEAWSDFTLRRATPGARWIGTTDRAQQDALPEVSEALAGGQIATRPLNSSGQMGIAVPIKVRDVSIGALRLVVPQTAWTDELRTTLESIAGHVAQAAENARLLDETQVRFARERALSAATDRIRSRTEVERVLETAAAELARYLNTNTVAVRMNSNVTGDGSEKSSDRVADLER